jgi:hypothetical protein
MLLTDEDKNWIAETIVGSLSTMEARLNEGMRAQTEPLAAAIASVSNEMAEGFKAVTSRFDIQASRLDRQAALIQTGSRWINRMNDWADNGRFPRQEE